MKNRPWVVGVKFQSLMSMGAQLVSKHQTVNEMPFSSKYFVICSP